LLPTIGLIDVGANATNIVVGSNFTFWCRSVQFGADRFAKALVREFQLTTTQAETVLRNFGKAQQLGKLYKTLEPICREFLSEVQTSIDLFAKANQDQAIDRFLGVGGGFQTHGLFRCLRSGR
jgi:Tfp pilus assembly PilM family ATPase